ncbi:MAG: SCP2 sterol-binding domain-containing protein [Chloroflexi bacterium]|nr:SCP2 sterol-binding domain-containing protein [Chloroflexota bacterium]
MPQVEYSGVVGRGTVSILEGSTFVVSDLLGDIDASPAQPEGLFHLDTRYLSRWQLSIEGQPLQPLSTDDLQYFSTQFFLVPGTGTIYSDATLSVIRKRSVGDGFHEDLTILNHGQAPVDLQLRLTAAADFADLFEVKDALAKKGELYRRVDERRLALGYRRAAFVRETWITTTAPEARFDEQGLSFGIRLEPHGEWTTCLEVVTALQGDMKPIARSKYGHEDRPGESDLELGLDELRASAPRLVSDWDVLERVYERSITDLAALRFYPRVLPGRALPAAGLPWFMAIFGRDSLITSLQALPFVPGFAASALRILAARQATRVDNFRDAEPGKILHEQRFGELTAFEERPHSPYFGSADATPLFLILLDEYERWTGDRELVQELEPAARRALRWIDAYGDRDGDGYVEYERRNTATGLENQCWKDSWNSILFADGSLAKLPRATCEIQGYVYDAKVRCARLARQLWNDAELASRLRAEANELKRRFNRDYWLAERQCYALALDGDKRPVDSLTSNIGHLLWSGIVDDNKADAVVEHLLGPRLFSGWGVRTMAEGEGGYNPIGYHLGTVWPHDNSLIALGLQRYGYRQQATQVALSILEAATYFDGRLPEAFAGYSRQRTRFPVEYPTACSPQAWATGAPLLLLRAILGLKPENDILSSDPMLPEQIGRLELRGLPWRGGRTDIIAGPRGDGQRGPSQPPIPARPAAPKSARDYFATFNERLDAAQLAGVRCSYRFDVEGAGSWRVVVVAGAATVTESSEDADAVIAASEDVLLRIARWEQNAGTAYLSGQLRVQGDLGLAERLLKALAGPAWPAASD